MKRIFAAAAVAAMLATFFCGCTSDDPDTSPSATIKPSNTPVVTSNVTTSPSPEVTESASPNVSTSPTAVIPGITDDLLSPSPSATPKE